MANWQAEEKALYEESRALKMKARALRAKRLAAEEAKAKLEKAEAEKQKRLADGAKKTARDARIRRALLNMADAAKAEGLAFEAPFGFYGTSPKQLAFTLIDKQEGGKIPISTHPTGFSWD